MRTPEDGFSHIVLLILLVAVAVVGSGYLVYGRSHQPTVMDSSGAAANTTPTLAHPGSSNTVTGVTSAIGSITTSLNTSENALDSQYATSDSTSDASLGSAASSFGGAYNANNF